MGIKFRNAVKLRGEVLAVDQGGHAVTLLTKQMRQNDTYEDEHIIIVPKAADVKKIKKGAFVEFLAQLDRDSDPYTTQIVSRQFRIADPTEGYENLVELVGRVPHSATLLPATEGKVSLVNLSIEVGGKIFNGVSFRGLASMLDRVWLKGAIARLGGRIRRREFEDRNFKTQISVEVVAEDKAEASVIKQARMTDKFGDFGLMEDDSDSNAEQSNAGTESGSEAAVPAV